MTDKQSQTIGIRFNEKSLSRLDELVLKLGYKSRSDCVKGLVDEKYLSLDKGEFLTKDSLLLLIAEDSDVENAVAKLIERLITSKKVCIG